MCDFNLYIICMNALHCVLQSQMCSQNHVILKVVLPQAVIIKSRRTDVAMCCMAYVTKYLLVRSQAGGRVAAWSVEYG